MDPARLLACRDRAALPGARGHRRQALAVGRGTRNKASHKRPGSGPSVSAVGKVEDEEGALGEEEAEKSTTWPWMTRSTDVADRAADNEAEADRREASAVSGTGPEEEDEERDDDNRARRRCPARCWSRGGS